MNATMKARIILEMSEQGNPKVSGLPSGYCLVIRVPENSGQFPSDALLQDLPDNIHRNDEGDLYFETVLT